MWFVQTRKHSVFLEMGTLSKRYEEVWSALNASKDRRGGRSMSQLDDDIV